MTRYTLSLAFAAVLAATGCAQSGANGSDHPRAQRSTATSTTPAAESLTTAANAEPSKQQRAVGAGLYELAFSPRQNAVFVAATGGRGKDAAAPRILRLNPVSLEVETLIELPRGGFGMALDDAADRLYVGTQNASILVIDTGSNRVIDEIALAQKRPLPGPDGKVEDRFPHGFRQLVLDADNQRLYAPGLAFKDSALYVVDLKSRRLSTVLPDFGFLATGIALDPARHQLYVSNLQGQLHTIDTRTLAVTKRSNTEGDQLLNLVVDPARNRVLATDQGLTMIDGMRQKAIGPNATPRGEGNQVVVIDPASGALIERIPTGLGPVALLLDAPRHRLYVTNRDAGTIAAYDSRTYAPIATVAVPTHPNSLTLNPATGAIYATVKNGKDAGPNAQESVVKLTF